MATNQSILEWKPVARIRRNHALEHATMQLLGRGRARSPLAGYSDPQGFWIVGEVDTGDVMEAVAQALTRLRSGERSLAIHPHCGTNFVAAGLIGGLVAWLAMLLTGKGWQKKLERLPVVVSLVTLAVVLAQPLGPYLQEKVTTQPDPGPLEIVGVFQHRRGRLLVHRIVTRA